MCHVAAGQLPNPYAAPRCAIFMAATNNVDFSLYWANAFVFFLFVQQTFRRITDKIPFALSFVTEFIS